MRLRFLQTYDDCGVDSERTLQYWNNNHGYWEDIEFVRCHEDDERVYDPPFDWNDE